MVQRWTSILMLCLAGSAQPSRPSAGLSQVVAQARTRPITPRPEHPEWMDWTRVSRGLAFYSKHSQDIDRILGTSSLVSTYAAKDITPVLMRTGRLAHDYNQRILETGQWIGVILTQRTTQDYFLRVNYQRAVALGKLHLGIAQTITAEKLGWNPNERIPVNQQAYALVLYSFAWQPVEALSAMHAIDTAAEAQELAGWFHLWSVIGYAMGVDPELLPQSFERASSIVPELRKAQYASAGEDRPAGIPVLLKGEMNMLLITDPRAKPLSREDAQSLEAASLAQALARSPGLPQALGLTDNAARELLDLVRER